MRIAPIETGNGVTGPGGAVAVCTACPVAPFADAPGAGALPLCRATRCGGCSSGADAEGDSDGGAEGGDADDDAAPGGVRICLTLRVRSGATNTRAYGSSAVMLPMRSVAGFET